MKNYFPDSRYITPEDTKIYKGDYLFFRTRLYFYLLLLKRIVFTSIFKARRGLYNREFWAQSSFDTVRDLEGCGVKFDISGIDNISNVEGPVIFIANHMSNLETFVLPSVILPFKPVTFIVKKSLLDAPFFGEIMKATKAIGVGRANPREDLQNVLLKGTEYLREGTSIVVFPQSTRSSNFDKNKFNSLGIKIARRSKVPVIPIALKTDCLSNGKIFKDFGKLKRNKTVYFKVGQPVYIEGNGKVEHEKIVRFISTSLREWGVNLI